MRLPEPTLPGFPPVLQKAIPLQVGEPRADHPTLWSTALVVSSSRDPLLPVLVSLHYRSLQPPLDQMQHVPLHHSASHGLEQFAVGDGVKVFGQVGVYYLGVAGLE